MESHQRVGVGRLDVLLPSLLFHLLTMAAQKVSLSLPLVFVSEVHFSYDCFTEDL